MLFLTFPPLQPWGKKKRPGKNLALSRLLGMESELPEEPSLWVLRRRGESEGGVSHEVSGSAAFPWTIT